MNLKDSLDNLLRRLVNNDEQLAVIFKSYQNKNNTIVYLPVGVVSGKLDEENLSFSCNNKKFNHLISGPKDYGFAFSKSFTDEVRNNKLIPSMLKKKLMLKSLQRFYYIYSRDDNNNPVVGVQSINDSENIDILYEEELLNYYIKKFPSAKDIISLLKKASGKLNLDIKEIAKSLEDNYTNASQSKQVLTAIWKHYYSDKSYNIFINGNDITPKREIVKSICETSNIPYYYVSSVKNYEITDISETLKELLKQNNGFLDRAENTILIIDNIDKLALTDLSSDSFANAQYNLARILRGETIKLEYNRFKKVNFDTSKMMIIGMGNFIDEEIKDITISGFNAAKIIEHNSKEKYKSGMLDGFFDNFSMIIQMDNPNLNDYQSFLLRRENDCVNNNMNFFNNLNIKLSFSEEVINEIAKVAYDKKMTQCDIRDFIENLLSSASFEIAMHPDEYAELEITLETIKDNKKYTLVKRKSN